MLDVIFPITCPECRKESLTSLPSEKIDRAVLSGGPLLLRSSCHKIEWQASRREVEQIKAYLWAAQLA